MRTLLLGLLPLACTVSSAAPSNGKVESKKIATTATAPIIENGTGCGQQMADGRAMPKGRPGVARSRDMDEAGDAEDAPAVTRGAMPPPPPAPTKSAAVGGGAATGAKADAKVASSSPAPMQQPSGVRAGEWDDNANYRDYVKWLAASPIKGKLDIRQRQFLVVTDKAGKPMPNCSITISDGNQKSASLVTMASGRALLFPQVFGLSGQLTATASCNGTTATAKLDAKTLDGVAKLELGTQRALPAKRTVELAFVLDTTGSMSEEIDAVKQTIRAVSEQLSTAQTDVRIGLVEYKDRSDCLLTRTFPFSSDLPAFGKSVAAISADGGGDFPEDMHAGLSAALDKLQWRSDSAARMIVVIADAPPQFYAQSKDYTDAAKRAAQKGIKLYTVAASGMDNLGQVVMRQMAQFTGASNLFVLRGGAGPQSVGGGDPKSSCGGTHQDYSSGKLDQLIMRKVRQELASLDADPMKIPGRGQDENAKPCEQRLVVAN
ncbi:MAG TPA: vWA domain-containing protein [Kofleriaceae bacterium]|nr:vWA domain-containing protein [Kofleriaceae bacterium]